MRSITDLLISQCNALGVTVSCTNLTSPLPCNLPPLQSRKLKAQTPESAFPSGSLCIDLPLEKSLQKYPALKHLLLHFGETRRAILPDPISRQMCQLQKTTLATPSALPCCPRLTVSRAGKISAPLSSQLSSHSTLPLTSLCLTHFPRVPAGSTLSPAALCRGATPGQSCLSQALPAC